MLFIFCNARSDIKHCKRSGMCLVLFRRVEFAPVSNSEIVYQHRSSWSVEFFCEAPRLYTDWLISHLYIYILNVNYYN